jgi:maltose/moltooligosaccharide transporter
LLPTLFSDVFGFSNESLNGTIPDTVRYSFYAGGAIYFLAVMWTVFFSYELPPADLQAFQAARQKKSEWLT